MFESGEYVIGAVIIALISLICWAGYKEQQAWESFKVVHHCVLTGKTKGQTVTVVGSNGGAGVGTTFPQATYLCDDGVSYTREEF